MTDYDRLFKELLATFFVEFLELFFPAIHAHTDLNSLTFLDKEVFTDVTSGEKHEADLVARARLRGQDSFFLFHLESQSERQEHFGLRMFRYFARFHEKYALPVYPIAVLSFDSPRKLQPHTYRVDFPDGPVLDFSYRLVQLNRLHWRDFVNKPNPVASALMAKMSIAKKDRPRVKAECLRLVLTLKLNDAKMQLISGFIATYLRLNAEDEQQFKQVLKEIAPEKEEKAMQLMNSWEEKGWHRGKLEGKLELVLRLLEKRGGLLSQELRGQVAALPPNDLDELSLALLDFNSQSDLLHWFDERIIH